jgi:predicted SprT family Zn-dependent metalloprotease
MQIPKRISVGKKTYEITRPQTVQDPAAHGRTYFEENRIEIARFDNQGNTFEQEEIDDTFWHELTHCILYDMGHDLCDNERFVIAFANRLSQAVNSAKL